MEKVPVLLIIHKRPAETRQVFEAIRRYRPDRLYVVADGPRLHVEGEQVLAEQARAEATAVDWPCRLITLFRIENMGCGPSVKTGIDWFFEAEEKGVILEDDCVPGPDFFQFCQTLLDKYEKDERIGMISGMNRVNYSPKGGFDFFFSAVPDTWGWASWRRAWQCMDFNMNWRLERTPNQVLKNMSPTSRLRHSWRRAIRLLDSGAVSTWDWQWYFSLAHHNMLTVLPAGSLVTNIGFGPGATHTLKPARGLIQILRPLSFPLLEPKALAPDGHYLKLLSKNTFPDQRPLVLARQFLVKKVIRRFFDFFYRRIFNKAVWSSK
jgi:hypothetical protein